MNPYLIAAIGIGAYLLFRHGPTVAALLRLEFSFFSFDIINIGTDSIKATIVMAAENKSGTDILMQKINAGILLNNKMIGLLTHNYNLLIRANSRQLLPIQIDIKKSQVGAELWNMIINVQTDFRFEISGKVTANNAGYPLNVTWTMDDIIEIINPKPVQNTVIKGIGATALTSGQKIFLQQFGDSEFEFVEPYKSL
ncbi:MAG: hypothetical protein GX102_15345 [Porphyromonadaceae bacterium]|nr:hypothetical protein [Porphyromonadaceae bacterium]